MVALLLLSRCGGGGGRRCSGSVVIVMFWWQSRCWLCECRCAGVHRGPVTMVVSKRREKKKMCASCHAVWVVALSVNEFVWMRS